MSLDTLADEITKQAKGEAQSILDEARAEAKRIEEEADNMTLYDLIFAHGGFGDVEFKKTAYLNREIGRAHV